MTQVVAVEPPLDFVEAELNYLKPGQGRPVNYVITPPPGVPQRTGEVERATTVWRA